MDLNKEDQHRLQCLLEDIEAKNRACLGYPSAKDFDFRLLADFLHYPLNNVGDPFAEGTYRVSSREFEREVLQFMAEFLRAPEGNWWGYVNNGSTEGNLYGLYLARELYPRGIVYFSQDTHYSVSKNVHFLNLRHIMIRSQSHGEIDYEDLQETLNIHRDVPAIVFANIGTTMKEAKDDVRRIREIVEDLAMVDCYIHSDAALCGFIAPFVKPRAAFDFADGADSVAVSGHKFIGSPIPSGIVLARKENVDRIARSVAYIGSMDTTITGSRNGLTPLMLWHTIRTMGLAGIRRRVRASIDMAAYVEQELKAVGVAAWRNPNAITVLFPKPSAEIRLKWQLANSGELAHIIAMPGTEKDVLDNFISDIAAEQGG
jgi:histidine decarboxylase